MAEVRPPLKISSRLMAALDIPNVGTLHLHAEARNGEGRVQYRYVIEDTEGHEVDEGDDLYSGVGADVDYTATMETLLAFLEHYAEAYRRTMSGSALHEWCYMHSDELAMARLELEPEEDQ